MQNKTVKLFALAALAAATTFGASAESKYEYFAGMDFGARLSGQHEAENAGQKDSADMSDSLVLGLKGGIILNRKHQFSLGYDYRGVSLDNSDSELEVGTLYTRYDYLVPITQKLSWTVGGKLGYEMFNDKEGYDEFYDDLDGVVLGAQTGLNYRFNDWSIGSEISYLYHTNEMEKGDQKYKIGDEVLLMANVQYHF